jgi:hypothetical protein
MVSPDGLNLSVTVKVTVSPVCSRTVTVDSGSERLPGSDCTTLGGVTIMHSVGAKDSEGEAEENELGVLDGPTDIVAVGVPDGLALGLADGLALGLALVGLGLGPGVGPGVGLTLGALESVGLPVGADEG